MKRYQSNQACSFDAEINFKWIYYSSTSRDHLPVNHKLAGNSTEVLVEKIIEDMLRIDSQGGTTTLQADDLLQLNLLRDLITRTVLNLRSFHIPHAKKKKMNDTSTCPKSMNALTSCSFKLLATEVEELLSLENTKSKEEQVPPVFRHAVSWKNVKSTVFNIIKTIVPFEMVGSNHNRKILSNFVNEILSCGKGDTITLSSLLNKLDLSHIRWLQSISNLERKAQVVGVVFTWIIQSIILSLVKVIYYITETSTHKNQMFFFDKSDWQHLRDEELNRFFSSERLRLLKRSEMKQLLSIAKTESVAYVTGSLRFIPKPNGLRPVLQCSGLEISMYESRVYKIFLGLISQNLFESYSSDFVSFPCQWRSMASQIRSFSKVYVVKVDVKDAYGSILQDVLIELIQEGAMRIGSAFEIMEFTRKHNAGIRSRKVFYLPVRSDGTPILRNGQDASHFVPRSTKKQIDVKETVKKLIQLVSCQLVQVTSNKFGLLRQGVAQGAKVSSALCDLYYSAICHKYLGKYNNLHGRLLRSVDDFIYISCRKDHATSFLNLMQAGFPKFNCFINPLKTVHNLEGEPSKVSFRGYSFCSLSKDILIDVNALAVNDPRYSLKIKVGGDFKRICREKVQQISKARWPSLFSDPSVTSKLGVARNIYRLGISLTARLVALFRTFSQNGHNVRGFLFLELKKACSKLWIKVSRKWDNSLFSRDLFMYLFFRGVLGILQTKKIKSMLFAMQTIVNSFLYRQYAKLSSCDQAVLSDLSTM